MSIAEILDTMDYGPALETETDAGVREFMEEAVETLGG